MGHMRIHKRNWGHGDKQTDTREGWIVRGRSSMRVPPQGPLPPLSGLDGDAIQGRVWDWTRNYVFPSLLVAQIL